MSAHGRDKRDEDMTSFPLNLVKEARRSTNYISDLPNSFLK